MKLSIIIPAFREEKKISKDIIEAKKYLKKNKIVGEIIVVIDDISDPTKNIVKKHQKVTLVITNGRGKGLAIKKGVETAHGEYILFADAGLCVPFECLVFPKNFDLAIGSRVLVKSEIKSYQPVYRRLGSKVFWLVTKLLGVPKDINDTQCGFKVFKKATAKKLFSDLKTHGFMFDIEILLRAKKLKMKIDQFPIKWKNDPDTKFNPVWGTKQNIIDLLKIKFLMKL